MVGENPGELRMAKIDRVIASLAEKQVLDTLLAQRRERVQRMEGDDEWKNWIRGLP